MNGAAGFQVSKWFAWPSAIYYVTRVMSAKKRKQHSAVVSYGMLNSDPVRDIL